MPEKKIVILGGGLSGLSCGYTAAADSGNSVLILEKEKTPGGLARSVHFGDYIVDLGPHRFHSKDERLVYFVGGIIENELIENNKNTSLYFHDNYYDYPFKINDLLKGLNWNLKVRSIIDFIRSRLSPNTDEKSFKKYVTNRFGETLFNIFFGPYTEKVWGVSTTLLDSEFAVQRIASEGLWDVIYKTIIQSTPLIKKYYHPHSPYEKRFWYPKSGTGEIAAGLSTEIVNRGGLIHYGSEITSITHRDGKITSVEYKVNGQKTSVPCDFLVSTLPVNVLLNYLMPVPDEQICSHVNKLIYRALVIVYLFYDTERICPYHWIYYCEDDFKFNRITEYKNFSSFLMPEGTTCISYEITCREGDDVWDIADAEIVKDCIRGSEKIGLIPDGVSVTGHKVVRIAEAYPVFTIGYQNHLNAVLEYFKEFSNFISIGRQGLFRYINQDQAMEMGTLAGKYLNGTAPRNAAETVGTKSVYLG